MSLESITGRLVLRPGSTPAVLCERPMVGAALLERLTAGRRAVLLPELLAAVFTLCADAQRSTSRRAVRAALGMFDNTADAERDALSIALHVVRDHLQRLALDLPTLTGAMPASPQWLLDAPVMALPAAGGGTEAQALRHAATALPGWLERRLFGMPPQAWLDAWLADGGTWLERWCHQDEHPVAHWLATVREDALAVAWPCRALQVLHDPESELPALAAAMAADPGFAERPLWQGAPAETGPWTRHATGRPTMTVWERLGARLADIARMAALPDAPRLIGALRLGPGSGIAWTEMARGLLLHWVQLEDGPHDASSARAAHCHVLAPTEWNFHPDGAFGQWLRASTPSPRQLRLAAATLDPCVEFAIERVEREARHA